MRTQNAFVQLINHLLPRNISWIRDDAQRVLKWKGFSKLHLTWEVKKKLECSLQKKFFLPQKINWKSHQWSFRSRLIDTIQTRLHTRNQINRPIKTEFDADIFKFFLQAIGNESNLKDLFFNSNSDIQLQ